MAIAITHDTGFLATAGSLLGALCGGFGALLHYVRGIDRKISSRETHDAKQDERLRSLEREVFK